jgi:hypothetical protein
MMALPSTSLLRYATIERSIENLASHNIIDVRKIIHLPWNAGVP